MFSESCDLFKFWEMINNISLTVQDRGIVATEYFKEIVCGLSNGTIECPWMSLFLFETFLSLIPDETYHEVTNIVRRAVPLR